MKTSGRATLFIVLLMISMAVQILPSDQGADGSPSRGAEEDLRMIIDVEFNGITSYYLDIEVNIYRMTFDDMIHNSTVLREMYQLDPSETLEMIGNEVEGRVENLTSSSFSGDQHEMVKSELVLSTLDINLSDTDPIRYEISITGEMDLTRYLDKETIGRLESGREDMFIIAMLMSGFEFSRSATLRADTGQVVTYHFPASWDPLGDAAVEILLRESGVDPEDGEYIKELDSAQGELVDHFTFTLRAKPRSFFNGEVISGDIILDWYRLDMLDIKGDVLLGPLGSDRSEVLSNLPPSMSTPDAIPPGFIRFAHGEGMLLDKDISEIEEQVAQEMEESLADKIGGGEVNIAASLELPAYTAPNNGAQLHSMIGDLDPNVVDVLTNVPLELDILDEYKLDDVLGLLNGGLRIRREMEQITDDRLTVNITLPENIVFFGETPAAQNGERRTYPYLNGFKQVGSSIAPEYSDEKVVLDAVIDLSQVNSHYFSDMEIEVGMTATISIHRIKFDPDDYEVNTDLDYQLDYLTSDLIRILDRMEMVNRSEIEDKVRQEVMDLIEDLMEEESRDIHVALTDSSMTFDDDYDAVDDEIPIHIEVTAKGVTRPLGDIEGSEEAADKVLRFLPPHLNPLIPARTIIKTIDISGTREWDTELKVIFPSGSGIKAWLGDGSLDRVSELDVIVEDGYPTLVLTPQDGAGDHITLELSVGPYFAYNNVTACFCSATGVALLLLLMMVLFIIKGIVRRKKENTEGSEETMSDGESSDDDATDIVTTEEDGETLNW